MIDKKIEKNKSQIKETIICLICVIIFFVLIYYLYILLCPLILFSSVTVSFLVIMFYELIRNKLYKKQYHNANIIFSYLFLLSSLILFVSILFLSFPNQPEGRNLTHQNVSFDIYIINHIFTKEDVFNYIKEANKIWNKYNISILADDIYFKDINLSREEIQYLFTKVNNSKEENEECIEYLHILSKFVNNDKKLKIIFLDNLGSNIRGRGCLCGCSFAIVAPDKLFTDFTGWDLAHEIGHILNLYDINENIKMNLMNNRHKPLFLKSDYLSQEQVNNVTKKAISLNT